jgi:hypothetical protein
VDPWDVDDPARELLENVCGFALGAIPSGLSMLPESEELEIIAGDGSGGCFYLWHAQRGGDRVPVVYLSSYGEASRFAEDFTDALTIVAAFPGYWGDVLVAAHKSDELLARVIPHYEADLEPDYAEARDELCGLLGLDPAGAVAKIVAAVRAKPAFAPQLESGQGVTPAASFAARPYPR